MLELEREVLKWEKKNLEQEQKVNLVEELLVRREEEVAQLKQGFNQYREKYLQEAQESYKLSERFKSVVEDSKTHLQYI